MISIHNIILKLYTNSRLSISKFTDFKTPKIQRNKKKIDLYILKPKTNNIRYNNIISKSCTNLKLPIS